ncbi:hypothetical protein G4B88_022183 [Cannabis sativa]|uniref:Sulfotransferase n=1 Tax=Cannabis sativa TaxID=3483 RepID=A0A7J6FXR5_CANSA|nr:hypothetical protein G4B88_022183 [Cannabis sativa]
MPYKILFLKYEELKKDDVFFIKKIADSLGFPFSKEEEHCGVPQRIVQLCSFENLKNMDVNKTGKRPIGMSNSSFFRKDEIGGWVKNHVFEPEKQQGALAQCVCWGHD